MNEPNLNTSTENISAVENMPQQAFGIRLRESRELAGLSVLDVSEALKLKEEIIKALENSQIDKLPVSAFTQGYIRSYCRLLKLPAEELIESYNKMLPQQEVPLTSTTDVSIQKTSRDGGVKIVTVLLVAAGLFLLALWWLQTEPQQPVSEVSSAEEIIVDPQHTEAVNAETAEAQSDESVQAEEVTIDVVEENNTVQDKTNTQLTAVQTSVEPEVTKPAPVIVKRQILPGNDTLVVRSNADSWTEIEDENGQRLLFQLVKAGDYYQLQGRAPFRVFLGNAPSVEIVVNDQVVDITNFIRQNNIAHIAIKANASVQAVRSSNREKSESDSGAVE